MSELESPVAPASVAVCAITYMRPVGIARLLASLSGLTFAENPDVAVRVVVVDNDAEGSARRIVEEAARDLPWPVRYEVEPERGISYARNRAVAAAGDRDFIAFVDDDEFVDPAWLDRFLTTQREHDADAVAGRVIPVFESEPPRWVVEGGVFEGFRERTGTVMKWASTSSVLIRRAALAGIPGPFDPRFALSGGEDTLLFMRLVRSGATVVWCDEAVVREIIPASRANLGWIVRRAYRRGNTQALCERTVSARRTGALIPLAKGMVRLGQGLAALVPALPRGRARLVPHLSTVVHGAGMIVAVVGVRFEEYRTIHGS